MKSLSPAFAGLLYFYSLMRMTLTLCAALLCLSGHAQRSLASAQWSLSTGTSNHVGELASMDGLLQEVRPVVQTSLTYFKGPRWGYGIHASYGQLFADNVNYGQSEFTGIQIRTNYVETHARLTYHLNKYGQYWMRNPNTFYIFGDAGLLMSASQYMDDVSYPMDVEINEGTNYSPTYGGGFGWKLRHNHHWHTTLEYSFWSVPGDRLEGFTWTGAENGLKGPAADGLFSLSAGVTYTFYTW